MTTINKTDKKCVLIKRTLAIAILCIALIVSLTSCTQVGGSSEVLSKDTLTQNVNKQAGTSYDYAAEYFDLWQLPRFNMTKIKTVEKRFYDRGITELPSTLELARETALYFLDNYYDGDKAIDLTDQEAVTDALLYSLVYKTGDEYAFYRDANQTDSFDDDMSGEFCDIGISVQKNSDGTCLIIQVYDGSGAEAAGILAGDILTEVDGVVLTAGNQDATIDAIKGTEGTTVNITVLRNGEQKSFDVVRSQIQVPSVEYKIIESAGEKIGYILISSFKANTDEQFIDTIDKLEAEGCRGFMFDLRYNGGGYLDSVINMIDYLIPDRSKIVSYKEKNSAETVIYSKTTHRMKVPSVVLCNGYTASAAELFCAAMRDYNKDYTFTSVLVGETTYGKGVMQNSYSMRDGSSVTLTTAYYNPPCGVNYNKIGVVPDISIKDDPDTTADEQYNAGLAELTSLVQMKNGTISKELIRSNMSADDSEELKYISAYLRMWKFPPFDIRRVNDIQKIYETNVSTITVSEVAKNVASTFLEKYYSKTALNDESKVTMALINAWLEVTDDKFAIYRTPDEYANENQDGIGSAGVGISYVQETGEVTRVLEGGAADLAGIISGDVLLKVNNWRFSGNEERIKRLFQDTAKDLEIELLRNGYDEPIKVTIERIYFESSNYKIIDGDIGYIKITRFKNSSVVDFKAAMTALKQQNVKGIIFDVRDNKGGELTQVVRVIEQFAKLDAPIITIDYFNEQYTDQTIRSTKNGTLGVPVVVICNESTASAAELFTAAMRDYAASGDIVAKIVGDEKTFGKGVMQSTRILGDGAAVTYTVANYYPPSGVGYNDVGITPDYIVEGSAAQDAKALEVLRELIASQ